MGRSRSSSSSSSPPRGRRTRSRSRSVEIEGTRVHVGELSSSANQDEIKRAFSKYGAIREVWMAQNPPCFAFVVFKHPADAEEACRKLNGSTVSGGRVRVSVALPRSRQRKQLRPFSMDMRCYQCGERGHFSRECTGGGQNRNRRSPQRSSRSPRGRRDRRSRSRSARRSGGSRSPSKSRRDRSMGRRGGSRERRPSDGDRDRKRGGAEGDGRRSGERGRRERSRDREPKERRRSREERSSKGARDRKRSRDISVRHTGEEEGDVGPTAAEILAANS